MGLERIPRFRLAALPTPLDDAPRLSDALKGPRILIKRDDLTGLALGGNKTRKLEYLIAAALAEGADVVLTVGAAQSNHCRQTAAAARKAGLRCILVLGRSEHNEMQGNLLLDALLDADVRMVDANPGAAMERIAEEERRGGARPYLIPGGGSNGLGALGYAQCVLELQTQLLERGGSADYLYLSSGSGGTQGGLLLGARMFSAGYRIVGVSPGGAAAGVRASALRAASEGASRLGLPLAFAESDFVVHDEYVGPGYAIPTAASNEAIRLFAQTEGLIVDPVYTAKAAAGLIDHVRTGRIERDATVVFLHTGGQPALFAYHAELAGALQGSQVRQDRVGVAGD
jgi:D-cysteine desulfhydrase family pyridoxal phosphate-dependent enzyme